MSKQRRGRERGESKQRRGREREERIPGRLCTISTEPDSGLDLTNRDIVP